MFFEYLVKSYFSFRVLVSLFVSVFVSVDFSFYEECVYVGVLEVMGEFEFFRKDV